MVTKLSPSAVLIALIMAGAIYQSSDKAPDRAWPSIPTETRFFDDAQVFPEADHRPDPVTSVMLTAIATWLS